MECVCFGKKKKKKVLERIRRGVNVLVEKTKRCSF